MKRPELNRLALALFALTLGCSGAVPQPVDNHASGGGHEAAAKHHSGGHRGHHGAGHHRRHGRFDDPAKWASVFEADDRDQWQKPNAVIAALKLPETAVMAEIGASTGYWSVRLARARPKGRVHGVDIEPAMVRWLADRARKEGIPNLTAALAKPDDPQIAERVDLVLVCNTYHHISDRSAYFRKLIPRLLPGGRVAIIDFRMGKLPFGPAERMRVAPDRLVAELAEAGYSVVLRDEKLLPYQYLVVFAPAAQPSDATAR